MSETKPYRYYQQDADDAIYECLCILRNSKCIVKKFCGTGKSLVMRYCKIAREAVLVVYVLPTLSLIDQFNKDYLFDIPKKNVIKISSDDESTTNPEKIQTFLSKKLSRKIICVTYQSFKTLIDNLGQNKIDVCMFDEAHHAVGKTYQNLIFQNNYCVKQIFFTATPKNANGIVMHDPENPDTGMCGKLVYEYSYLNGVDDGYLNPFEIRIDFSLENNKNSIYESIARAILATNNNKVLTFHADVNTTSNTSVNHFVNESEFILTFQRIQKTEFPSITKYTNIKMLGLTAQMSVKERSKHLDRFYNTPDNHVFVISSCETIGEGIDTKNANMCVFVDPKSSYVKIIQNIGRIVRKEYGKEKPNSTILIPCFVDKTKYLDCQQNKEKCDEVIRQDIQEGGNFNGILNVMSALNQSDTELYDQCLHYPDTFSPKEITNNLKKQGYQVLDTVDEDDGIIENVAFIIQDNIDFELYQDTQTDQELLNRLAEDHDICIEVHTNSLETPIEKYNFESASNNIVRLYKSVDEENERYLWQPILQIDQLNKKNTDIINPPRQENKIRINVHSNPDVKVLWNVVGEIDLTKNICSCVIDCEVVKYDPLLIAEGIKERAKNRHENGLNFLPKRTTNKSTPELIEENRDAEKLKKWKQALNGKGSSKCSDEVRDYLDTHLKGWRDKVVDTLLIAEGIKERANSRHENGLNFLPRQTTNKSTPELIEENKDAQRLRDWKKALNGKGKSKCSDEVRDYLDTHLKGWRDNVDEIALQFAIGIKERANSRHENGLNFLPRQTTNKSTPELIEENKDAIKLRDWKKALNGKGKSKCSDEVRDYLDTHLKGWRDELDEIALQFAIGITERAKNRHENGLNFLPRQTKNKSTPELIEENKDAIKLNNWKQALNGKGPSKCSDEVRDYLDTHLKGWRDYLDEIALQFAIGIKERAKNRHENGLNFLPRETKNKSTPELIEENKDAKKLDKWKQALNGKGAHKCSDEVRDYLDTHLKGWRENPASKTKPSSAKKNTEETVKSMKLKNVPMKKGFSEKKRENVKSEISKLHQLYKTLKSENLYEKFNENPELWHTYHEISEENEKSFPENEIPRNRIIDELNKIKTNREKLVVDMGCGKGDISSHYLNDRRFRFINYDHISLNDSIISCDISNIPLEDNCVEICILSLAMWGSNCRAYVKEASRILESGGQLLIIEPTKRWSEQDENKNIIENKEGSKMVSLLIENDLKIVRQSIEKFCLFVCVKV
jgi:superfamily II DNA or RNA helicase